MAIVRLDRLTAIRSLEAHQMSLQDAAAQLGLSTRQVRRMRLAYRTMGSTGLVHGNRGRRPHNKLDAGVCELVLEVAAAFGSHRTEQRIADRLAREHGANISRSTVHRLLTTMMGSPGAGPGGGDASDAQRRWPVLVAEAPEEDLLAPAACRSITALRSVLDERYTS